MVTMKVNFDLLGSSFHTDYALSSSFGSPFLCEVRDSTA
jgi:hypothetical protein